MTRKAIAQLTVWIVIVLANGTIHAEAPAYRLGPGDQITASVRDRKEIEMKPALIGADGAVELPYTGRIQAQGLSTQELAREIETKLKSIVLNPVVTVEVTDYGSQPVSVLGAVNKPGVHKLRGNQTLIEVLSLAEGLKNEAGNIIKITRAKSSGELPLPNAKQDSTGEYTSAEVRIKGLLDARAPELNIQIRAHDVITVPRAELVYVLGNVHRPGGFPLTERESITVLQALAMAEGLEPGALTSSAKILRPSESSDAPVEIAVNVKKILANTALDQPLKPNDVLFIPNSATKTVGIRALEAGLQMATGVVIFRH
jgi:polysaccharide export outer membrane protein